MLDTITVGDTELYYQDAGEGPALVMLHGFGGNHLSWFGQVPALSETYRCVATDQRMFGLSADRDGEGVGVWVDDLVSLLDHLDVDRAALIGHSMSGWPVASFATQYPDRTAALVLSATPGGLLPPDEHASLQAEAEGAIPDVDPLSPARAFLADSIRELNRHAPAEFADIRPTLDDLPLDPDRIVEAGVPTYLITGEGDTFLPEPAMEALSARLDGCPYDIVPEAGHSANFDRPSAFNRLVAGFLDEHARF